jgi:hypothetical protein
LVGLFAVLRIGRHAMIHTDTDGQLQRKEHFRENGFHAPAERQSLFRIRLREQESEFVSPDTERRIGSAQSTFEGCCGCTKNLISTRMAMLIVHFFETMQIKDNQAQRGTVASPAIKLFLKCLAE